MNSEIKHAGFWSRFFATVIDSIWLYGIIYAVLWHLIGPDIFYPDAKYTVTQFIFEWAIPLVVVMAFWATKASTPGKMLLNMKIVDAETHQTVPLQRLFIRYLAYFVSMLPLCLGFIWIAWDKKKQGWHDKIARTVVLRR